MKPLYITLSAVILVLASCSPAQSVLTVMTHDSFAISEQLVAAFEQEHNVKLVFLASGDSGAALNKAILSKQAPLADVFYGLDNTFLSRALQENIFEVYSSPLLDQVPDEFKPGLENSVVPVDYGDICINYDKYWFDDHDLAVPDTLMDLLKPEYYGLLVTENPASSSPGLAFLMATIASFGPDDYLDYWSMLKDNGLLVVDGWETAYYTNFSGSSGHGSQPMVVSYASSPAAEVIFADPPIAEAPTAAITAPGTCYRQIEYAGILAGTSKQTLAQEFIDFLLSVQFQEDIPLQMFMYPVNRNAQLPPEFIQWAQVAEDPTSIDPALIATNRESWITAWTEIMYR